MKKYALPLVLFLMLLTACDAPAAPVPPPEEPQPAVRVPNAILSPPWRRMRPPPISPAGL